eukprot:9100333-Pyramimonas_sp.AAC.1
MSVGISWGGFPRASERHLLETFGAFSVPFGGLWASWEPRVAFPEAVLEPLSAVLGAAWAVLELSWAVLREYWESFGPSWSGSGCFARVRPRREGREGVYAKS